jgi:urea transport system substrate-binding protein
VATELTRRRLVQTAGAGAAAAGAGPWIIREAMGADKIKVASIVDVSGGLDIYGGPMFNCINLAVEEMNKTGGLLGREIQLINYDPQSNIQLYTQYATEAATKEHVDVVQGGITSASREAIRPILRRFETLYFYNTLYEGGVCDRNTFCTGTTPGQTVAKLVPYIVKKWGKKAYTVAADYSYGQITAKWFKKFMEDSGGEVLASEFFPLDVTDFGPTLAKIQAARPDFILSALVGGAHISFYRQWAAAGINKTVPIAGNFGDGNEQILLSPAESDGIYAAYGYFQEIKSPANEAFVNAYFRRFGGNAAPLTELAVMQYTGFQLWAAAVKKANTTDRIKVIEALETGLSYDGPAGKSTIDAATHHNITDVYIAVVENHKFNVVEKFDQLPPSDTAAVCNLKKNPNNNQQYVIDVKT